jgi:hypothetical protein
LELGEGEGGGETEEREGGEDEGGGESHFGGLWWLRRERRKDAGMGGMCRIVEVQLFVCFSISWRAKVVDPPLAWMNAI